MRFKHFEIWKNMTNIVPQIKPAMKSILLTCLLLTGSLICFCQQPASDTLKDIQDLKTTREKLTAKMDTLQTMTDAMETRIWDIRQKLDRLKAGPDGAKESEKKRNGKIKQYQKDIDQMEKHVKEDKAIVDECHGIIKEIDDKIKALEKT